MSLNPPPSVDQIDATRWETIQPYVTELAQRALPAADVADWLADWSHLSEVVGEAATWLSIAYSRNTEDDTRKAAYLDYVRQVSPHLRTAEQQLKERLLQTGWEAPGMEEVLRRFRSDAALFRPDNVPLLAEEQAVAARYSETLGSLTVSFQGAERTLSQLAPFRALPERDVREGAWRAGHERLADVRPHLDELFDQLLGLRRRIAANAGFANYRDFRWQHMGRLDYTPADAERFQRSVREVVVPALRRRSARRAEDLGLKPLRPWDLEVDPHGTAPLRPFSGGDELADGVARIFDRVHPDFGGMVRTMRSEGLLDLENRKGKAPGGYCATLPARGRPFIFMNAVGTEDNLRTMLHEAGHAFHVFERAALPYFWQRGAPLEFAEVASMSMELLAAPYITREAGGFYERREAVRSRIQHLERIIDFLPYMAAVDAFQHWVYAHPEHDRQARDAAWLELHERYCVAADWQGLEATRSSLWQHKQHIFQAPFYYIEYGLAQVGALQVWARSVTDPEAALRDYRAALALGSTRPLPELFAAAGARLAFEPEPLAEVVALVERTLGQLEAELAEA